MSFPPLFHLPLLFPSTYLLLALASPRLSTPASLSLSLWSFGGNDGDAAAPLHFGAHALAAAQTK